MTGIPVSDQPIDKTAAWLVLSVIVSASVLAYTGHLDSSGYWKTTTLSLGMLLLGAPVATLASVWTVTKAQAILRAEK